MKWVEEVEWPPGSGRKSGYKVDRRVFAAILIIITIWVVAGMAEAGFQWNNPVISCPADEFQPCMNPYVITFYDEGKVIYGCLAADPSWCEPPVLQPGETAGRREGFFARSVVLVSLILILAGLLINHVLVNRRSLSWRG